MSFSPCILMYHHLAAAALDPPPVFAANYVPRDELAAQLDHLAAWGYRTLTLADASRRARSGPPPGRKSVVLTFDDAGRSVLEHALPELAARGMTATVFAVSTEVGGWNRWDAEHGERREPLLAAGELRQLAEAGIEIGSHGRTHAHLTTLGEAELQREVEGSKAELEALLARPVTTFCYPYGEVDERVAAAVRRAGYRAAVSVGERCDDELYALPRYPVRPGESPLELRLKVSGLYRYWRRLPRLGLLAGLRDKADRPAGGGKTARPAGGAPR